MKLFKLSGELYFNAEDINDAFIRLALHFISLAAGEDSHVAVPETNIKLDLVETKDGE